MAYTDTRPPFFERPDLSPYLVHLTKNSRADDDCSAYQNLDKILKWGKIRGSKGYIKGPNSATCFMDIPLSSLKYVFNKSNTDSSFPRYEPYGIVVSKSYAYEQGARPVLYLSDSELVEMDIPKDHLWRVVKFDGIGEKSIGWIHEREWRARGNFSLPEWLEAVLVENTSDVQSLTRSIDHHKKDYISLPQSIIPLMVLCQGLPYMK